MSMTRCIQETNSGAGFISEHSRFCTSLNGACEENVEYHVRISYFCANMCRAHKDKFIARHKNAEVTEAIILERKGK